METQDPIRRRQRGQQLEADVARRGWNELVEVGFANLTMESVAARARTGIAVLYRRWANKDELVLAAIKHYRNNHPVDLPDTGALRGDLLAALTGMSEAGAAFFAIAAATAFSGLLAGTGLTPTQVRDADHGRPTTRARSHHLPARPRPRRDRPRPHPPRCARYAVRPGAPRPAHGSQTPDSHTHPIDHRRAFLPLVHSHHNGPGSRSH